MAEPLPLDFAGDDRLAGFRLMRLEVLNWGTFDQRVWALELDGKTACSPAISVLASQLWSTP